MAFAHCFSAQTDLLSGRIVDVEVDTSPGLYSFSIVGLPDKAVEEARDRISAAIKNSGFKSPKAKNVKVVISLAPASLKKEGSSFDLSMALSYLLSSKEVDFNNKNKIFLGELSLDGGVRPIRGTLSLVKTAKDAGFEEIFIPEKNSKEAQLIKGIKIFPTKNLKEVIDHLTGKKKIQETTGDDIKNTEVEPEIDISDIKGQEAGKRGLLISASGGHNDLFLWKSLFEIERIGHTVDDSAGESMDKVGRSLGLPFPAGRYIDELAQKYNPDIHKNIPQFPLVLPEETLNFSFSGLKSSALREIEIREKHHGKLTETDLIKISYGYQKTIVTILSERLIEARKKLGTKSLALVG